MRLAHLLPALVALAVAVPAAAAGSDLHLSKLTLTATADLGEATFQYAFRLENASANAAIQLYVEHTVGGAAGGDGRKGVYEALSPATADGKPLILPLSQGMESRGSFTIPLRKGHWGSTRLLLFRSSDGKTVDYGQLLYDSALDPKAPRLQLDLTIRTEQKRVVAPVLEFRRRVSDTTHGDGSHTVMVSAVVKVPADFRNNENGLWAMAKGSGGFSQVWVPLDRAQSANDPFDSYRTAPVEFKLEAVKPGLWNVQFGLFKPSFGAPLQWLYPGLDFEAGGDAWVQRAPAERIPARLRVRKGRFETLQGQPHDFYPDAPAARHAAAFIRGGDYGNAITWTVQPLLNSPGYFARLRGLGCRWVRFTFDPDRYLDEALYRHVVDQVVQNIWSGGLHPVVCPQDLPKGDTPEEQAARGQRVVELLAREYQGKSAWLEVCNEPHSFSTWSAWKPVAVRYVKAIRAIDPDALVIVPFEGYSKDGRAAARDPITDVAVDLYDGHAYVEPDEIASRFGSAVEAGLPVMIGEYGGGPEYLARLQTALQQLSPGLLAAGPWAFTVAGQDSLPLVADGSTTELQLTPAGKVVVEFFAAWNAGKKKP